MNELPENSGTHAIIPVKDPTRAKERLGGVLNGPGREMFFRAMASDVLDAVTASTRLDSVWVVTRDDAVRDAAIARGLNVLRESESRGQTEAVRFGIRHVVSRNARTVMTLPADLPLVTGRSIDAVIAAHEKTGRTSTACTFVTDAARLGTNIAVMSPPGLIPLGFGNTSYAPHVAAARAMNAGPLEVEHPELARDIDRPSDLVALADYARSNPGWNTRTRRWLSTPVGLEAVDNARRIARES